MMGHMCVPSDVRTSSTYKNVKLSPYKAVEVYRCVSCDVEHHAKQRGNYVALSPQVDYTDWATAEADEVVPTFAGWGCCVASTTNLYVC
jgi:hypothetical protein